MTYDKSGLYIIVVETTPQNLVAILIYYSPHLVAGEAVAFKLVPVWKFYA
jgi:hypothetical protein